MALPIRVARGFVDPVDMIAREVDNVLGRFFMPRGNVEDGGGGGAVGRSMSPYGVDIREDADHIYVEADLPGFKKEEVEITLENQTLTIMAQRGERLEKPQGEQAEWLLNERRYSRFLRSFTLPPTVDEQKVEARLEDGVLMITLTRREETKPRKIQVG